MAAPEIMKPYTELNNKERALVESADPIDRTRAINAHLAWDRFLHDNDDMVCYALAQQNYRPAHEAFKKHPSGFVRIGVVQNCDPDILDEMIDDPDPEVRRAIAYRGYKLDILSHDDASIVRQAVAEYGYGLDMLFHDPEERVVNAVEAYLCELEQGKTVDEWIVDNRDRCVMPENRQDAANGVVFWL